jgi:hypothetical protein
MITLHMGDTPEKEFHFEYLSKSKVVFETGGGFFVSGVAKNSLTRSIKDGNNICFLSFAQPASCWPAKRQKSLYLFLIVTAGAGPRR